MCVYAPLEVHSPVPVLRSLSIANPSDIMSHYIALTPCVLVWPHGVINTDQASYQFKTKRFFTGHYNLKETLSVVRHKLLCLLKQCFYTDDSGYVNIGLAKINVFLCS